MHVRNKRCLRRSKARNNSTRRSVWLQRMINGILKMYVDMSVFNVYNCILRQSQQCMYLFVLLHSIFQSLDDGWGGGGGGGAMC